MSLDNFLYSSSAEDLDYPNIRPTLDLNFIRNQKVPPFVNVTRNSQTTYVDKFGILRTADINQPIFEWDPITGKCLGARIWGAVTNDSKATEAIGGTGWTNQNSLSVSLNSTDVIDPAGGNKASKLTWGATNSQTLMPFTAAADVYSAGVWLRTLTGTANVNLFVFLQASPFTVIGMANVAVTSAWRRLSVTTSTATAAGYNFDIQLTGAGSVYAFGSQVNRGTVLGPYVQNNSTTLAASSTRDVWSITGADFSRIWNQSAGTIYGDGNSTSGPFIVARATATPNNRIQFGPDNVQSAVIDGGAIQYISPTGAGKRAMAFAANDFAQQIQEQSINPDPSGTVPSVDYMTLGRYDFGGGETLNGYIRRLTIYPKRLTDSQLKALTR